MKKIVMIFAAMAAVLSSCQKSELESVSANDGKDIVLNISVSDPGAETKALIKTAWAAGDEISIWYDENVQENPDLVITYNGTKWIQKQGATVSDNTPSTSGGYAKALYNGTVKVASKDNYTYENNTLTFNIENWKFLTEIQVVVKGLTSASAGSYTLACDKFTPLAGTGNGYTVNTDGITASAGNKGVAVTGISNTDGVAFVFATADYSSTAAAFNFTLIDNTTTPAVTKVYTATTDKINGTSGEMTAIKALTIANDKFKVPVNPLFVEIEADYDNDPSTPNTSLKWYRQNLAITDSGKKAWKGTNTSSTVKVPGTNEDVKVGDYFQWAASYKGYGIEEEANKKPENLLIYTAFTNTGCGESENKFTFRSAGDGKTYHFASYDYDIYIGISPYYDKEEEEPYTKYNDSDQTEKLDTISTSNDDVAHIILGGTWRMPTSDEFTAMKAATYWAWDGTDKGYYVFWPGQGTTGAAGGISNIADTDKKADALLFFPAAGYGSTDYFYFAGEYGYYWSSYHSLENNEDSNHLLIASGVVFTSGYGRYNGMSVRPVSD